MPATTAAEGTSRSGPGPSQAAVFAADGSAGCSRPPHRRTIRRWISAARVASISCSVTAQASASHAHGRRLGRCHGSMVDRLADQRVAAEGARELGQVVVDAEREAHPLDRKLERRGRRRGFGVSARRAHADALARGLPGVNDDAAFRR